MVLKSAIDLDPQAIASSAPPGRHCPLHYRYSPDVFQDDAPSRLSELDVLYVVGGLYGNDIALERILVLFDRETGRKRLVFNGDFHWFDVDPDVFGRVQSTVLAYDALRGNVETELATDTGDAQVGCGCAYPDWIGEGVVERSNLMLERLRSATTDDQRVALRTLPMWLRADVGPLRIGIVHGDATSLAGWGFAQEHLLDPTHRREIARWFARGGVDAFACTHTCLPVFQRLRAGHDSEPRWIFNNGAAGMPNFAGDRAGLLTRLATSPFPGGGRRFGVRVAAGEVHVDAIAIEFDSSAWMNQFCRQWPMDSAARVSYMERIVHGPDYTVNNAVRMEA